MTIEIKRVEAANLQKELEALDTPFRDLIIVPQAISGQGDVTQYLLIIDRS